MSERQQRDRWTMFFGPPCSVDSRECVVIAPELSDLARAFERCRALLDSDDIGCVRLIGRGVSIARHRPSWVPEVSRPLLLTEIDAYLPRDKRPAFEALVPALERWLDEVLDGVVPGIAASRVFWSSAVERLLRPILEAWLVGSVVSRMHRGDRIECVSPTWRGLDLISNAAESGRPPLVGHPLQLAVLGAAFAKRAMEFLHERATRARLRSQRCALAAQPRPTIFIAQHGAWLRANRGVLDAVTDYVRSIGAQVGVVIQSSLIPGVRNSETGPFEPGPLLPALDAPELVGLLARVDQGISVERAADLLRVFAETARAGISAAIRASRAKLEVTIANTTVRVPLDPMHLAKLFTIDVLRAREAVHATTAMLARESMAGATVVFPHAASVNDATMDQLLQRAGVRTIELVHGGLGELTAHLGDTRTATSMKALWTEYEASVMQRLDPRQSHMGGFYPRPIPAPPRRDLLRREETLRVLITSNYLVSAWGHDPAKWEPYQRPLIRSVEAVRGTRDCKIRWRPHPGDDPALVAEILAEHRAIVRSTSSLDDDLRWCDVLVSSVSSVTVDALFYDVPMFVHEIPRWERLILDVYEPSRRFASADKLVTAVERCVPLLEHGDPAALEPERATLRRLFGPSMRPRAIGELFNELSAERRASRA